MKKIISLVAGSFIGITVVVVVVSQGYPLKYIQTADPLHLAVAVCAGFILACFLLAWITGDYSQTDRLWSIAPAIYAWIFAASAWPDVRVILMASLVTIWGARLSFNFARKGGYTSEEDYRWPILRDKITNPILWQLFNLFFIAGYQHVQVLLISIPAYIVCREGYRPINPIDVVAAGLLIGLLVIETIADEQMWHFQQKKKNLIASGEALTGEFKRGFISSGLYRYSRHPNYFAEISIWWAFYLFVPAATGQWIHWSIIGAVSLTILFQGSVWFVERISSGKYPAYVEYQRKVSRLLPWFSKPLDRE